VVEKGDLLLAFFTANINPTVTWDQNSHGLWRLLISEFGNASSVLGEIWAKVADGTEQGGALSVTTDLGRDSAHRVWAIKDWSGGLDGIKASAVDGGVTADPDPPNLDAGWSAKETLWIAFVARDQLTEASAFPFPDNQDTQVTTGGDADTCNDAICSVTDYTSIKNPGIFTAVSKAHAAFTIAVLGTSPDVPLGPAVIRKPIDPYNKAKLNRTHWLAKDLTHWYPSPDNAGLWLDRSLFDRGPINLDSGTSPLVPTIHGNNAIDFTSGLSEFTSTSLGILPGLALWSMGFWAKGSSYGESAFGLTIYQVGGSSSQLVGIYPFDNDVGNGVRYFHMGAGAIINQNSGAASLNEWHWYFVTQRGSGSTDVEAYVDGISVGVGDPLGFNNLDSAMDEIGIGHWRGGQNANFEMKDVTIYSRSFTSEEIWQWYTNERWGLYLPRTINFGETPERDVVRF